MILEKIQGKSHQAASRWVRRRAERHRRSFSGFFVDTYRQGLEMLINEGRFEDIGLLGLTR